MPELPEVETIARSLDDVLRSKTIKEVKFFRDSLREKIPTLKVKEVLEGETVEEGDESEESEESEEGEAVEEGDE